MISYNVKKVRFFWLFLFLCSLANAQSVIGIVRTSSGPVYHRVLFNGNYITSLKNKEKLIYTLSSEGRVQIFLEGYQLGSSNSYLNINRKTFITANKDHYFKIVKKEGWFLEVISKSEFDGYSKKIEVKSFYEDSSSPIVKLKDKKAPILSFLSSNVNRDQATIDISNDPKVIGVFEEEGLVKECKINDKPIQLKGTQFEIDLSQYSKDKVTFYCMDNSYNSFEKEFTIIESKHKPDLQIININKATFRNTNEKRVALLIGNSKYTKTAKLKNPENDVVLMQGVFDSLNFETIQVINGDYNAMLAGLKSFSTTAKDADVAVFYYAGHGLQFDGKNYLIPVDANIESKESVALETMDMAIVLRTMELTKNKDRLNLIILDACRNNPFNSWSRGGESGLAPATPANGTIVAYSTSPNSTASDGLGSNGLYTEQLAKQLLKPQRIEDVFINTRIQVEDKSQGKQSPWEVARLRGSYSFLKEKD